MNRKRDVCSFEREEKKKIKPDQTKIREILKSPAGKASGLQFVDPDFMSVYGEVRMM